LFHTPSLLLLREAVNRYDGTQPITPHKEGRAHPMLERQGLPHARLVSKLTFFLTLFLTLPAYNKSILTRYFIAHMEKDGRIFSQPLLSLDKCEIFGNTIDIFR
jgi:hypothetical protein